MRFILRLSVADTARAGGTHGAPITGGHAPAGRQLRPWSLLTSLSATYTLGS